MTEYILDLTAFDGETLDDGLREEIVRCRDCVKRSKEPDPPVCGPGKVDSWIDWCIKHNCEVEPDGFCAWGKRKEGSDDQ